MGPLRLSKGDEKVTVRSLFTFTNSWKGRIVVPAAMIMISINISNVLLFWVQFLNHLLKNELFTITYQRTTFLYSSPWFYIYMQENRAWNF